MALLRANNSPLLDGKEKSFLVANSAAGTATVTVKDYAQFAVGLPVLIGNLGSESSEIIRIHTSTAPTSAGVVTLASNLVYAHSINDPITQIDFNQVEFSRATTVAGSKSVLATQAIEADDLYTVYNDTVNSTGYGFLRFKNSYTTVYSSYSDAIPYAGLPENSVAMMKKRALQITHTEISDKISDDFILSELNNWQDEIGQMKDWDFEQTTLTDTIVTDQEDYTIPVTMKEQDSNKSVLNIHYTDSLPLEYIDKNKYDLVNYDPPASGTPTQFTIYEGVLYLFPAPSSTFSGDTLTYVVRRKIPALTSDSSETIITFYTISQYYLAWKIELEKGNKDQGDYWRGIYENRLSGVMRRNRTGQEARFHPII